MNDRTNFDVSQQGAQWTTGIPGGSEVHFDTREKAIAAATDAARMCWEKHGLPSAVRSQSEDGTWFEECTFGWVNP